MPSNDISVKFSYVIATNVVPKEFHSMYMQGILRSHNTRESLLNPLKRFTFASMLGIITRVSNAKTVIFQVTW